jgi:hypothetical protein
MTIARFVRSFIFATAAAASSSELGAQGPAPLRVIRTTPGSDANPLAEISITFDRPVAGSLDRAVDPATIFRMLPEPYRFSFRAQGPTIVYASPGPTARGDWTNLPLDARFSIVYSSPVDLASLSSAAYIEFAAACAGGDRVVRLRATGQRAVASTDAPNMERHYEGDPQARADTMRRIVQLGPERTLPRDCGGELVAPKDLSDASRGVERWKLLTHGDLRIAELTCAEKQYCARGPLRVQFSTPVSGAEVLRHVKLIPDAKIAIRDTVSEHTQWWLEAKLEPRTTYALVVDTAMRDVFGQR